VPTALIENVTSLNLQGQILLQDENITDLTGIEGFTALNSLTVNDNELTTLDLSSNILLEQVNLSYNKLTSIDLGTNTTLKDLNVSDNLLTSIDVSNTTNLEVLNTNGNGIADIDLSNNTSLIELRMGGYNSESLDLSQLPNLTSIDLRSTRLTNVNVKNGANENITSFDATFNNNLTCILVDDVTQDFTNWSKEDTASYSDTYCRYTAIPDYFFETRLLTLGYDDQSGDAKVPTALIETVTDLDIENLAITDLTGIEDFVALTSLDVSNNRLTSLDVSHNINLEELRIGDNEISSIDLSSLSKLEIFAAENNDLTSLDVSNNANLETIFIISNTISTLDISNLSNLRDLTLINSGLTELNTEGATSLFTINVSNNNLQSLDLSSNSSLKIITLRNNALTNLNVQNGTNEQVTIFDAASNPSLNCILVDDVSYSTTEWSRFVDDHTSFSETSCNTEFSLDLKVYLQGAALNPNTGEESLMRDDLREDNLLPVTSPYTDGLTAGGFAFNFTGVNAIVDWVWIELRDANDTTQVAYSRSALLQRDGDIVDVDGTSVLDFSTEEDTYYVVIKHRNHLGIMTSSAITFVENDTVSLDFSTNTSIVNGGTNAVADMGSGVFALIAGDQDANGQVQNTDTNTVITLLGGFGYSDADMDMNGQVQNTDINNLMNPNVGKGEQF